MQCDKWEKCLPAMQETRVQSLDREDPLEKEMATHSSTLAWKIPWTEDAGMLQSMGLQRVGNNWETTLTHSLTHSSREKQQATCTGNPIRLTDLSTEIL